jgi:Domain of unknown function (DUF4760)
MTSGWTFAIQAPTGSSATSWSLGWGAVEALGVVTAFLINFVLLAVVFAQLRSDKASKSLDHERRCKEATFHYWQGLQESALAARRLLTQHYGSDEMTSAEAAKLVLAANGAVGDERDRYSEVLYGLREYLNGLERLALGIEMSIFDLDVIDAMGNTTVRRAWERNHAYIDLVRKDTPTGRQYDGLQRLHGLLTEKHLIRMKTINGGAPQPMGSSVRI